MAFCLQFRPVAKECPKPVGRGKAPNFDPPPSFRGVIDGSQGVAGPLASHPRRLQSRSREALPPVWSRRDEACRAIERDRSKTYPGHHCDARYGHKLPLQLSGPAIGKIDIEALLLADASEACAIGSSCTSRAMLAPLPTVDHCPYTRTRKGDPKAAFA